MSSAKPYLPADALLAALAAALRQEGNAWAHVPLVHMPDKGLAHDHVRLLGTGVLARIPKQSQMQLGAQDNLAYQVACFLRTNTNTNTNAGANSGASVDSFTPQLRGVLPPSQWLPRGALLVEEIVGRSAQLAQDLGAIVRALAAMHCLPVPPSSQHAPLVHSADPLQALLDEVLQQANYLGAAALAPQVSGAIEQELHRLRTICAAQARPAVHLIAFDAHPGNFVVRADGRAVLVDLEKCRYSYPGLDLAHATLYTSTTWDVDTHAVLKLPEILQAYTLWAQVVGAAVGRAAQPWHVPLRRAMWLWSVTWCAKWRVVSGAAPHSTAHGEDWSAARSTTALVAHVRNRVDHYLSPGVVHQMRNEFDALQHALA